MFYSQFQKVLVEHRTSSKVEFYESLSFNAFGRCFYPNRLAFKVYILSLHALHSLGIKPMTLEFLVLCCLSYRNAHIHCLECNVSSFLSRQKFILLCAVKSRVIQEQKGAFETLSVNMQWNLQLNGAEQLYSFAE